MSKEDLTVQRDERCIPVAKKILSIVAREDLLLTTSKEVNDEAMHKYYEDLYEKEIVPMLLTTEGLLVSDVDYCFKLAMSAIDFTRFKATNTLQEREEQAIAYKFDVSNTNDISLKKLNEVLKEKLDKNA